MKPDRFSAAKGAATSFLDAGADGVQRRGRHVRRSGRDGRPSPGAAREATADAIEGLTASRGTVIGDGLTEALDAVAAERVDNADLPSAVVLLSDGADTGSVVPPADATARAREMGVPVFTVAIVGDEDQEGGDTALLQTIASDSGGSLSTADSAGELSRSTTRSARGSRGTSRSAVRRAALLAPRPC